MKDDLNPFFAGDFVSLMEFIETRSKYSASVVDFVKMRVEEVFISNLALD